MAVYVIPVRPGVPHFREEVELERVTYGFEFRWNERANAWFLSLSDAEGNALVSGIRVVTDFPLLFRFRKAGLPPGRLVVADTTGAGLDAGLHDFGLQRKLLYYESTELGGAA